MIMLYELMLFAACLFASVIFHEFGHYIASPKIVKFGRYDGEWCCKWKSCSPLENLRIYLVGGLLGMIPIVIFYNLTHQGMWTFLFVVAYLVGCWYDANMSVNIIRGVNDGEIYSDNKIDKGRKQNTDRDTKSNRSKQDKVKSPNIHGRIRHSKKKNTPK